MTEINDEEYWEIPEGIDTTDFDFEWRPDMFEPPYIHQFGTQWQKTGGPRFIVPDATQVKYENCQHAVALPNKTNWVIPDNVDVTHFDFSWHPDATERPYFYQFGTQWQKTGGPRYVVEAARRTKFIDAQHAIHLPDKSKFKVQEDAYTIDFDFSWHPDDTDVPCNYVFGNQFRTSKESASVIYPSTVEVNNYMEHPVATIGYRPLDIIFVSNGESGEQERYDRLCQVSGRTVKWVRGINGRENALRHAAEISESPWLILFPGKLYADENFNFNFQPDRYIEPKHYIFYAKNPLNGLEYGHQAAVCYNRQLVLETVDYGLDFTMSKLHDVVPMVSGIAEYNSDITMTWRTAFREVIKLIADGSPESLERLRVWKTTATGQHCEWSILGARDGVDYYESVNGDHAELMKTFSWTWLGEHFKTLYPSIQP